LFELFFLPKMYLRGGGMRNTSSRLGIQNTTIKQQKAAVAAADGRSGSATIKQQKAAVAAAAAAAADGGSGSGSGGGSGGGSSSGSSGGSGSTAQQQR
jgi:hypothetical protein